MESVILLSNSISEFYLGEIARMHYTAYSKKHFTSIFGLDKLKEYYKDLIESSDLSLFFLDNGVSVGFIVSGEHISKGVSIFINKNRFYILFKLLTHPRFLIEKMIDTMKTFIPKAETQVSKYRLMSIAVDSKLQSNGYGKKMLDDLENYLVKDLKKSYGLSVRKENDKAVKFYERNGFIKELETTDSYYFIKNIIKSI